MELLGVVESVIFSIWWSFFAIYDRIEYVLGSCMVPFVPDIIFKMMIFQPGWFLVFVVEVAIIITLLGEIIRLIIKRIC
jgi:hypothetical protein